MIYRHLGKTGLSVSQLGFGCMRLPMKGEGEQAIVDRDLATPMLHRAFEAGVNYVDTAVGYLNQDSQRALGEALKGWRDKIVVSTKNPYYEADESAWWKNLEDSLERLQVDYIDIYNHHGITWEAYVQNVEPRLSKLMLKAKEQGLIRHICTSFHDDNAALMKLIDTGYPEVITLQYNMLDRKLEEGIAYAREKGIGVVAMGPVAGGRLGASNDALNGIVPGIERIPELALRFVLSNPNVSLALSGMQTIQQLEENLLIASDSTALSRDDWTAIDEQLGRLKNMADLYCSGCKYCMPCPNDVNIPLIFEQMIMGKVYGVWELPRYYYGLLGNSEWIKGKKADACTECGACLEKCPQKLDIPAQLKEAHLALSREKEKS